MDEKTVDNKYFDMQTLDEWLEVFVQWVRDCPEQNARQIDTVLFKLAWMRFKDFDAFYWGVRGALSSLCNAQREAMLRVDGEVLERDG